MKYRFEDCFSDEDCSTVRQGEENRINKDRL